MESEDAVARGRRRRVHVHEFILIPSRSTGRPKDVERRRNFDIP
ncbi:hypothetical protein HMPREF3036_01655 [Sutterella sp. KLE1602]|nr:hypothetical protein HMPREF3036_01655 [Sutterella sp. KLE1602]